MQVSEQFVTADGQWERVLSERFSSPVPCLFLDRDGVIIEDRHYLSDPAGVQLISGADELIVSAREQGYAVVVVSNQSGIGRGRFGWKEHFAVESRMIELVTASGARFDALYACPFHAPARAGEAADHPWRKPNPGMILAASGALNLDRSRSWLVGDKLSDIQAAKAAGLRAGIHVLTGHGQDDAAGIFQEENKNFRVRQVPSARECIAFLSEFGH